MDKYSLFIASGNIPEMEKIAGMIQSVWPRLRLALSSSGKEAFFYLKKCDKEGRPSAIMLDFMLPDINGLDLLSVVKQSEKYRNVPVLVMSGTYTEPADRASVLFGGAEAFIQKPDLNGLEPVPDNVEWAVSFCKELAYHLKISYDTLRAQSSKKKIKKAMIFRTYKIRKKNLKKN